MMVAVVVPVDIELTQDFASTSPGSYTITIGGGGAKDSTSTRIDGSDTVFSTITSTAVGGGGFRSNTDSSTGRGADGYLTEVGICLVLIQVQEDLEIPTIFATTRSQRIFKVPLLIQFMEEEWWWCWCYWF